jgi:hypothetical protein
MGIWKQKGEPTPLEPVVLFTDSSFALSLEASESGAWPCIPWAGELAVEVQLDDDTWVPEPGTEVYVTGQSDGTVDVWRQDSTPRRVGRLVGEGVEVIAAFIRRAHSGLGAEISCTDRASSTGKVFVLFRGSEPA